jgi:RNA-binding protein YlmH
MTLNVVAGEALGGPLVVGAAEGRLRVDQFLVRRLPGAVSRSRVQRALEAEAVHVNGTVVSKAAVRLSVGDVVCGRPLVPDADHLK